jgi:hypothetical protein
MFEWEAEDDEEYMHMDKQVDLSEVDDVMDKLPSSLLSLNSNSLEASDETLSFRCLLFLMFNASNPDSGANECNHINIHTCFNVLDYTLTRLVLVDDQVHDNTDVIVDSQFGTSSILSLSMICH